jgi:hypothetical protein
LKSLVVLVFMAIAAYMTLRGLFSNFRLGVLGQVGVQLSTGQDLASLLAKWLGAERRAMEIASTVAVTGALLVFVFAKREFLRWETLLGGTVVGLVVVGGWYVSGRLGYLPEDPNTLREAWVATNTGRMESLSFVAPQAYLLELLMLWTDKSRIVTFGIASALGVIAGSAAYAIVSKTFRLESFRDPADMLRHIVGGILMGFGGVVALGCTIGQGITGFSTLAVGSIVAFFAIIAGAAATMKFEYWLISR